MSDHKQLSKCGVIDLGRKCHQDCLLCYHRFSDDEHYGYIPESIDFKPIKELKKEINHLAEQGRSRVAITGGEPLMHPDLHSLLRHCLKKNILPQIITAGLPKKARHILDSFGTEDVAWVLSLHGDPVMHNYITQRKNSFLNVLETLKIIHGTYYRFNYVVMSFNWQSLIHLQETYFPVMFDGHEHNNPFVAPMELSHPQEINILKWRPFYGWEREDGRYDNLAKQYLFDNNDIICSLGLQDLYVTAERFTSFVHFRYFPKCDIPKYMLGDKKCGWWGTLNYVYDPWEWLNEDLSEVDVEKMMQEKWEKRLYYNLDKCGDCPHLDPASKCEGHMKGYE